MPNARPPVDPDVAHAIGIDRSGRVRRWLWRGVGIAVLVVLAGGGGYLWWARTRTVPTAYESAAITQGDLEALVSATGTLEPMRTVQVGPEVSGRVSEVRVDFNDAVTHDQILAVIDPLPLAARRTEAQARLRAAIAAQAQATAARDEARVQVGRLSQLAARGAVSAQQLDTARSGLAQAEAAVQSAAANVALARAAVSSVRTDLERTEIRSPIDGVVLTRSVEPGQAVAATFAPPVLFVLAESLRRMRLVLAVDEADIGRVAIDQGVRFTVDAFPRQSFTGRVTAVHNAPRTVQGVVSYDVIVEVDNAELLLRPGMTASADIVVDRRTRVVLVPNAALRFTPAGAAEGEGDRVFVLRDGEPAPVRVRIGLTDGRSTELVDGELEPGARVLTDVIETQPRRAP